jgi:hypothetical protein
MVEKSVAIVVVTYRNPPRLASLLDNMEWAGLPDIPLYVFEDPSPRNDKDEISAQYIDLCMNRHIPYKRPKAWSNMQGVTEFALREITEDWIIWVPDDVIFTRGALWNEYAGILAYGRPWVGGIQAPYWLASDLVTMGSMPNREAMFNGWIPNGIPQNPFWNDQGLPRAYVNLNGAGFSLNRELWRVCGGIPQQTWRLDEYLGYMAWHIGYVIISLPGQPRIHYQGGSTPYGVAGGLWHTAEMYEQAIGKSIGDATGEIYSRMQELPGGQWHEMVKYFDKVLV